MNATNPHAEVAKFLGGFPDNYLIFDVETNGLDFRNDPAVRPTQIGYVVVLDRLPVASGEYMVDWTKGDFPIDRDRFVANVFATREAMLSRGKPCHVDWPTLSATGIEPAVALSRLGSLVDLVYARDGVSLVAHNGYAFDCPLVSKCWTDLGMPHRIDVNLLWDTGLIEKSIRAGLSPPVGGSTGREDWYSRVRDDRSRVKWSLDVACEEEYQLSARHRFDVALAHSAGFDSLACHYLMEAFRDRAGGPIQIEAVVPGN